MEHPVDATNDEISLDDLEKPVPGEFVKAAGVDPSAGVWSMPLGSVGSRSPGSQLEDFPELRKLHWQGNLIRGISRGISSSVDPPELMTPQLPSVRHGLSSTQFHPGAVARGVGPNLLLHAGGVLLQNGEGRRNDHHLSQELKRENLDMFISHSWTVGRWSKFVVMALYFNGQQAAIVSLLVQLLCFIGVCAGILPIVAAEATDVGISPWCFLCGSLAFWLCVFLWHELMLLCRRQSAMVFFDTVCIDQSDEEKKREGIEAITAYLCHSNKLFVVLSEVYLMRIWTVFEMAAFLAVKHAQLLDSQSVQGHSWHSWSGASAKSQVIVQPVALAALVPTCFLFQLARPVGDFARYTFRNSERPDGSRDIPALSSAAVFIIAGVFMSRDIPALSSAAVLIIAGVFMNSERPDGSRDIPALSSAAVLIIAGVFMSRDIPALSSAAVLIIAGVFMIIYLVTILKRWGQTRSQLAQQVDNFSFNSAKCHHEPDRREISLAVKYLADHTGLVDLDATINEAKEALERHPRELVWPAMEGALSPAGIPVWDAWLIALPVTALAFDDMAMSIMTLWNPRSISVLFTNAISHLVVAVNFPVIIALVSISSSRPQRRCCYEFLATSGCVLATFCFIAIRGYMNNQLLLISQGEGIPRLGLFLCVILLIQALILWCSYGSGLRHLRRCCC